MSGLVSRPLLALAAVCCGYAAVLNDMDAPPTLPDVESLMSEAADTANLFNTQADEVQALVARQQKNSLMSIAAQKDEFEAELQKMDENNTNMMAQNDNLRKEVRNLRQGNEKLFKDADKMEKASLVLRETLVALGPKIAVAKEFIASSLNQTNLTGHAALKVLDAPAPLPTLDHFLSVVKSTLSETESVEMKSAAVEAMGQDRVSLLEMSGSANPNSKAQPEFSAAPAHTSTAEDLVDTLSSSITSLGAAQEQGLAQLKAHFMALSEIRTNRYTVLAAEQQALNQTRENMVTLQAQLNTAKLHLSKTIDELKQRIQGIRVFAQSANKTAASAIEQAQKVQPISNVSIGSTIALLQSMHAFPVGVPHTAPKRVEM